MPTYTEQELNDMAAVGLWTRAQIDAAVAGGGGTGHTTADLLRSLMTALADCLHAKAQGPGAGTGP